jgi:hypothetical protein
MLDAIRAWQVGHAGVHESVLATAADAQAAS